MPEEKGITPEIEGLETEGPEIKEKVEVPPVETGEGDYENLAKKKNWKDYNAAAKSYTGLESQYGKVIAENKELRDYGQYIYDYLNGLEKAGKEKPPKEEGLGKEKLKELLETEPDEMTKIIKDMLGTELTPLKKGLEKATLDQALSDMKQDKKNYPYMSEELEGKMTAIFRGNKNLPSTRETLHLLYLAAVGFSVSDISGKAKKAGIDEAYKNIEGKMGAFSEGEQGREGGKTSTEDDKLIDAIIKAGGRTLI